MRPKTEEGRSRESRVTVELRELTIKRFVVLILIILIFVPLFDYQVYQPTNQYSTKARISFIYPLIVSKTV